MPIEIYPLEMEMLLSNGAILFDVSENSNQVRKPEKSESIPLSQLGELQEKISRSKPLIFCCRSGLLSYQAAKIAAHWTNQPVYYLPGGLLSVSDGR